MCTSEASIGSFACGCLKRTSTHVKADVEIKCWSTVELFYKIILSLNQRRSEMKSYQELKAEMAAIELKMVGSKARKR